MGLGKGQVDPEALLRRLGVDIQDIELDEPRLDAIAVWGDQRQPTVMINTRGARARYPTGRRSTCAHELCHLLVDTDGALPAVEVLGGRVPVDLEQRANAFAAELLLPRTDAGRVLQEKLAFVNTADARAIEIDNSVHELARDYQVSHETSAWQIMRSGKLPEADEGALQRYLKSILDPYA